MNLEDIQDRILEQLQGHRFADPPQLVVQGLILSLRLAHDDSTFVWLLQCVNRVRHPRSGVATKGLRPGPGVLIANPPAYFAESDLPDLLLAQGARGFGAAPSL